MDYPLTPAGYRHLVEELHYLEKVRRPEIANELRKAIEYGDITDSGEYETAKRDQALVEGRIEQLHELIGDAEVLHRSTPLTYADVGVRVTVQDLDSGEQKEYLLVSPLEARIHNGGLSVSSPIGQSLVECQVGDLVEVETPSGLRRFEVIALQDEATDG